MKLRPSPSLTPPPSIEQVGQADNPNYKFLNLFGGVLDHKLAGERHLRVGGWEGGRERGHEVGGCVCQGGEDVRVLRDDRAPGQPHPPIYIIPRPPFNPMPPPTAHHAGLRHDMDDRAPGRPQ